MGVVRLANIVVHVNHHVVACIRHFEKFWSFRLMPIRVTRVASLEWPIREHPRQREL